MTRAIFNKELKQLWASPLPYVLGAVFHATLGVLAWGQLGGRQQAVFQPIVPIAGFLLVVAAPILTSRTLAEEARTGTLELLLAIPVSTTKLVAAKYLAVLATLVVLIAPAGLFVVLLTLYGSPDAGPIVTGTVGLVVVAAGVGAIGVFASSLTTSQPLAAIAGLFLVMVLWFAHAGSDVLSVGGFLGGFSISERLRSFAGGVMDGGDVLYFLSLIAVSLAAARVAVESRRWR